MDKYIVGIDEVGRGCLAGPLVVAAVAVPIDLKIKSLKFQIPEKNKTILIPLRDSKKLLPQYREAWVKYFVNQGDIAWAVARVLPRTIEKKNVYRAANQAALSALKRLIASGAMHQKSCKIYLDGGLFCGNNFLNRSNLGRNITESSVKIANRSFAALTMAHGDEKIRAISIASIIAKVHRDRFMVRLAKKYPGYGLDIHKGYATLLHRKAVLALGPSAAHRMTFLKKIAVVV